MSGCWNFSQRKSPVSAFVGTGREAALLLACALGWSSLGCSDEGLPRAATVGTVSVDGQPLPSGVVRFLPTGETKGPVTVATVRDGRFELTEQEGPIVGSHRVEIEALDYVGFAIDDEAAYVQNVEQRRRVLPPNPIPPAYNRNSTLTATVQADQTNEFDFPVSTKTAAR